MTVTLDEVLETIREQVIADRRRLHANPELAFEEHETAAYVAERLRSLGLEVRTGVGKTGVVGVLRGREPGRSVLLRADMDALPIEEENDVPYRSTRPGAMHACGHDGHVAMLLGAARILSERRDSLAGTVVFAFQPSEERIPGGALGMIEDGAMDNPPVEAAFGIHLSNRIPAGAIGCRAGPANAAADTFKAEIVGKGGHASRPHIAVDPILISAHVVTAVHAIVSREVAPIESAVITIGTLHAGTVANVIPPNATLSGTVRTFDQTLREKLARRIEETIVGVARAMGGDASVDYQFGYPALINDPDMTALVEQVGRELLGEDKVIRNDPNMASDDVAYFLQRAPGCHFNVGAANEAKGFVWGNHHPRFDIDEDGLLVGVRMWVGLVERFLGRPA